MELKLNELVVQLQQAVHMVLLSPGEIKIEAAPTEENGMAKVGFNQLGTIRLGKSFKARWHISRTGFTSIAGRALFARRPPPDGDVRDLSGGAINGTPKMFVFGRSGLSREKRQILQQARVTSDGDAVRSRRLALAKAYMVSADGKRIAGICPLRYAREGPQ